MTLGAIRFDGLSPTDFEEFCFDLLVENGFVNVDWRKGTPKAASPADRGRDIVAHLERQDVDGHKYRETWFVDCKHYKRGVPPEALQGTIAWAQAERHAHRLAGCHLPGRLYCSQRCEERHVGGCVTKARYDSSRKGRPR